ncbi:hypothetical protein VOLCADRAFT_105503 [Volvox carteri f. nagariensis]|uniref:Nucleoporin p58/p45 n=1 Tax=Volvox carteri f. nagariensis TaxID=3068 RepID=D8U1A0_VOLCA|nr:uncharacterized protein VOLCADRAFT_105503 [Volvox carteri f. nagariensis]EFJ46521.1 hypothetical protein VOLCADRAFT_105503 [Volvox carteri f. nagariensis]|eukprot:XP_002952378.1 hypothetical protein VOLCADRAFT_105503 [Volvox carteri f. nagariensis]
MAFSFGSTAPAATPFTGGLFGAPAASSASAFGTSTVPAFGAASAPAFGASSAPAFGASSAPAFGASTAPAFGSATPFGAPAAGSTSPSLFGSTTTGFGTTNLFGQPASAPVTSTALVPAGGLFGAQPQQQAQQLQQPRPGLNYKTKFEELPPQIQQELQKIQQQISSYRDECKALDNDARLYDTVSIKQDLDSETAALRQTLQSLYQAVLAEDEGLLAFRERVMVLLRSTETAIRLYQRSKLWREISQVPGPGSGQQQLLLTQAVQDQMSQPVQLPNPYLGLAVRGFSAAIEQYHSCISELERVMQASAVGYGGTDEATAILNLPTLVSHMHNYFVHVAARMERLHGEVARAREAYLAQQRARGDYSNPFAEARPLHHIPAGPGKLAAALGGSGAASSNFYSFGGPAGGGGMGPGGGGIMGPGGGGGGGGGGMFGGGGSTAPAPAPAPMPSLGAPGGNTASGGGGLFGGLNPVAFGSSASPFDRYR